MGAYALEFDTDGGKATKVLHRPSNVLASVPESMQITGDYELQSNWNDVTAVCVKGPAKFRMQEFFDKDSGPNPLKSMVGKSEVFGTHARAALAKHLLKTSALQADQLTEDAEAFQAPMKEKQREATKRARAALMESQSENKTKRRVLVSSAAAASG
jgi:succinate dehydrogenase/fumarate reductase flavoprotein subunit